MLDHMKSVNINNGQRVFLHLIVLSIVISIALFCGLWRPRSFPAFTELTKSDVIKEIVISDTNGLVFKSENGKELAKIGKDEFGTYFNLLNGSGKPAVKISTIQDKGAVIVGTDDGSYVYITALEKGGNIALINRYGKQVLELSSGGNEGTGTAVLGDAK